MDESILINVKKILGLEATYTVFDADIITHINSVFATLHQLGVGPAEGYAIQDATDTWNEFISGYMPYNAIKSYMYLRVRVLFDPPQHAYMINALDSQIKELEWRINVVREFKEYQTSDG